MKHWTESLNNYLSYNVTILTSTTIFNPLETDVYLKKIRSVICSRYTPHSIRFSSNSEAYASELLEFLE